jgi:hypothetical protein
MFLRDQKVVCVDSSMGNIGPCLEPEEVYTVKEFLSPEECATWLPNNVIRWENEGGHMVLNEEPLLEFFGRRFRPYLEATAA